MQLFPGVDCYIDYFDGVGAPVIKFLENTRKLRKEELEVVREVAYELPEAFKDYPASWAMILDMQDYIDHRIVEKCREKHIIISGSVEKMPPEQEQEIQNYFVQGAMHHGV